MKITITDIGDITSTNLDENKVLIADNILNMVGPLFEKEIEETKGELTSIKQKRAKIEKDLLETKEKLQQLQSEFGQETKRKKLLNRIRQLIEVNLTQDPSLKSEVIILLKVIDKLEDNLLDEHIERMIKTISKRFSKNI
jgi:chromosome condensin MukBEF ATPase and DNA-binding subunit MukB